MVAALVGACGPTDACRQYVRCQQAYDPEVSTSAYEERGACWENLQTAEACDAQCAVALDALAGVPEPPKECTRADVSAPG